MRVTNSALIVALVIVLGAAANPAHAYIDPGTGSSLFSSLGVMLGAVVTMLALFVGQVRRCGGWFVARLRSGSAKDDSTDAAEDAGTPARAEPTDK